MNQKWLEMNFNPSRNYKGKRQNYFPIFRKRITFTSQSLRKQYSKTVRRNSQVKTTSVVEHFHNQIQNINQTLLQLLNASC